MPLTYVHLSDIHFTRLSEDVHDLDRDVRDQLEIDLGRLVTRLGPLSGVLVTGDIAFSGQSEEYATALEWLDNVTSICGCETSAVWTVPGNHDVDRTRAARPLHRLTRQAVREGKHDFIAALRDPEMGSQLYDSLGEYNEFAANYGCEMSPSKPVWYHRVELGLGYNVVLTGLNSCLVSGPEDHRFEARMRLGPCAHHLPERAEDVFIALCHHPPSWMFDEDSAQSELNSRARLQLFGHKHNLTIDETNNNIVIGAGATHPSRKERNWLPRYNIIRISACTNDGEVKLETAIYPRVWRRDGHAFQADNPGGTEELNYLLPLPKIFTSKRDHTQNAPVKKLDSIAEVTLMDPHRALVRRLLGQPLYVRRRAVARANLVNAEEAAELSHNPDWGALLGKARGDYSALANLWDCLNEETSTDEPNPFRKEAYE